MSGKTIAKKYRVFRNYDSTEKWLIKKQLLFLLIFFKSIFKYYEWSLQFTSMKLKRVISTKSINVNIIKLYFQKIPIGDIPQLTKYYTW